MSIEIFDNDKVSFTYEIESNMNDIVLNGSKYDWSEEVVDFEIGVYFDVLKDIGGVEKYAVSSYHLINTNNEGIDIKASFGDIKNHHLLKHDEQKASSAGEITKEWDIVTNADAKLNGKKITWTFDVPEGFNPYRIQISQLQDNGESYYWID